MSSGLLYLAIVGVWALVLVPMWVRRSDVGDSREAEAADAPSQERANTRSRGRARGRAGGRSRARVIARRRRRLSGILALLLVTVVIAATGTAPWWIVPVPGAALLGHLACLRAAALYDAELAERDRARAERAAARVRAASSAEEQAAEQAGTPGTFADRAAEAAAAAGDSRIIDFPTGNVRSAADSPGERDELFDQYADPPVRAVGD